MHHKLDLETLSPGEAGGLLTTLGDQLAGGIVAVGGHQVTVAGPVSVSMEVDASHALAHVSVTIRCQRPDGGSHLLEEELARPGG